MFVKTAAELRVRRLYRYQRFNAEHLVTYLKGMLYCASPNSFNDPWDCRPFFNTDCLDESDAFEKQIRFSECSDLKYGARPAEEHRRRIQQLGRDPALLKEIVKRTSAETADGINRDYGVCCFTTKGESIHPRSFS